MTDEQKAAYIMGLSACLFAKVLGDAALELLLWTKAHECPQEKSEQFFEYLSKPDQLETALRVANVLR